MFYHPCDVGGVVQNSQAEYGDNVILRDDEVQV